MRHLPYICQDKKSFIQSVMDFKKKYTATGSGIKTVLATLYVHVDMQELIPELISILSNELPRAQIVGGTVSANISKGYMEVKGISLTFTVFKEASIQVVPLEWEDSKARELGKDFLYFVRNLVQPVAIQLLASGYNLNVTPFFTEVSNCPPDIIFFGGVVDDGTMGPPGCVFTAERIIRRGMIAVVFMGHKLQALENSSCGWKPLGKSMTITKMEGNNTVKEIDYMPVRDIYQKYLGAGWDDDFLSETVIFPFCYDRKGVQINRLPRVIYDDGSANYGADFRLGETVRLAYGDPAHIIREAQKIQADLVRFQPDAIFATSCWARKALLHQHINQELELIRKNAPSSGIYAFGEYIRVNGDIICANMTLSIVAMREGSFQKNHMGLLLPTPVKLRGESLILSHMIHFVEAVSGELAAMNERLSRLAHIDSLTNLLNRGELESVMAKTLDYAHIVNKPVSVIMLDVDHFKHINDTYGHEIGDEALKMVAIILKDSIRHMDAAGRWGGDEFIVILSGATQENAIKIAERIRERIEGVTIPDYDSIRLTSSLGVTQATSEDTIVTLFSRVDKALYKAKNELGRNSVAVVSASGFPEKR